MEELYEKIKGMTVDEKDQYLKDIGLYEHIANARSHLLKDYVPKEDNEMQRMQEDIDQTSK